MKDPEFVKEMAKQEPEFQLARSLIEARIKRKLTQSKVAKIAKTDQATISRLESGVSKPSISLLQKSLLLWVPVSQSVLKFDKAKL